MILLRKSEIRELIRPLRGFISPSYRQKASSAAASLFIQSSFFQDHQRIGCYFALPVEIDTAPIIQALHQQKKSCYLPLVSTNLSDKKLSFALYQEESKLLPNRYQVPEPQASPEILPASELDIAIAPLLAFDESGTRLGTGGGFYDCTFSFLVTATQRKPLLIGLAYEIQQVEHLPREVFDVNLDGVITEERLILF